MSCQLAKLEIVGHKPAYYLNPVFTVDGRKVVLLMQEMAGASVKRLDTFVVALAELRPEIVRVLDVVEISDCSSIERLTSETGACHSRFLLGLGSGGIPVEPAS